VKTDPLIGPACRRGLCALLAAVAVADTGCTRRFFRRQADREVDAVLTEKNCNDAWRIQFYHLPPDPRSRFAAPYDPDRPPMPPDDPGARALSPNPQKPGKAGVGNPEGTAYLELIAAWDAENRAAQPAATGDEGPNTLVTTGPPVRDMEPVDKALQTNERPFLLTVDQAVELALFNSREFQDRREDLYLFALPVTLQRFAFTYQFLAAEEVIREYTGRDTPEGLGNRWRANTTLGFQKLFPTGALLLFRFANQVVVNMAAQNGPRVVTPSTISFDIVQPLLRGGGFAVTLEPLTQAERDLLYVVRGFARFRKEFYVAVAGGGDYTGNFAALGALFASGSAQTEGYFPTLLRAAQLQNEKQNVAELERIRRLYQALLEGGDVSQLQVDQVELNLLNSRANVLQQTQLLRDALDRFKLQLGVPTSLPIELDDRPFRPLIEQQRRFLEVVSEYEAIREIANRADWSLEPELLRERLRRLAQDAPLVAGTRFREQFPVRWAAVAALSNDQLAERLKALKAEARDLRFGKRTELEQSGQAVPAEMAARIVELDRDVDLLLFEQALRRFEAKPWERPGADPARQAAARASAYRDAASDFSVVLGEARAERIELTRQKWPELPRTALEGTDLITNDLDRATALVSQTALANRLDLMNARAQVVDAWRKIAVQANALFGVLDVRYHLDSATLPVGTQPFDFRPERSRHQLILNGELPLVRQAERNQYVASLIVFQRLRRTLQQAEDQVLAQVRSELRQLRFLAENYKIQQRAVELAYYQVESSLNVVQQPPRVVSANQLQSGGSSGSDSGSQAALTQQLLNAVSSLLRAQNQLYGVYQSYLVARMSLYRDLELLNQDRRGVWIDVDANPNGPDGCGPGSSGGRPDEAGVERLPAPRPVPGPGTPPAG